MDLRHYGAQPVRLAVSPANDPPAELVDFAAWLRERDLETSRPATRDDLAQVRALLGDWLGVVDADRSRSVHGGSTRCGNATPRIRA